jgi:hypothetical protein
MEYSQYIFYHVELIYDMVKYSTPHHGIFCHITYVIYWEIIIGATNVPNI